MYNPCISGLFYLFILLLNSFNSFIVSNSQCNNTTPFIIYNFSSFLFKGVFVKQKQTSSNATFDRNANKPSLLSPSVTTNIYKNYCYLYKNFVRFKLYVYNIIKLQFTVIFSFFYFFPFVCCHGCPFSCIQ